MFKVGDKLICKSGFTTNESSGGAGYKAGKKIIVERISEGRRLRPIIWPLNEGTGIYAEALRRQKNIHISFTKN